MEFERKRFFPEEMDEREEREYGFPAIEKDEKTPLAKEEQTKYWKKVKEHLMEAQEFRRNFFPVTPNDFFPIEGVVFELSLTERLLRNERYTQSRSLRIDFHPRDTLRFFRSRDRLKKPEEVYQDQNFLDQAMQLVNEWRDLLLREYAWQIGVDGKSGEFQAWAGSVRGLANNFSAAVFQGAGNDKLDGIIDGKKEGINQKRKVMLGLATFSEREVPNLRT